jgi:hypothetical protein
MEKKKKSVWFLVICLLLCLILLAASGFLAFISLTDKGDGDIPSMFGYGVISANGVYEGVKKDSLVIVKEVSEQELRVDNVIAFYNNDGTDSPFYLANILEILEDGTYIVYVGKDYGDISMKFSDMKGKAEYYVEGAGSVLDIFQGRYGVLISFGLVILFILFLVLIIANIIGNKRFNRELEEYYEEKEEKEIEEDDSDYEYIDEEETPETREVPVSEETEEETEITSEEGPAAPEETGEQIPVPVEEPKEEPAEETVKEEVPETPAREEPAEDTAEISIEVDDSISSESVLDIALAREMEFREEYPDFEPEEREFEESLTETVDEPVAEDVAGSPADEPCAEEESVQDEEPMAAEEPVQEVPAPVPAENKEMTVETSSFVKGSFGKDRVSFEVACDEDSAEIIKSRVDEEAKKRNRFGLFTSISHLDGCVVKVWCEWEDVLFVSQIISQVKRSGNGDIL